MQLVPSLVQPYYTFKPLIWCLSLYGLAFVYIVFHGNLEQFILTLQDCRWIRCGSTLWWYHACGNIGMVVKRGIPFSVNSNESDRVVNGLLLRDMVSCPSYDRVMFRSLDHLWIVSWILSSWWLVRKNSCIDPWMKPSFGYKERSSSTMSLIFCVHWSVGS